MVSRICCCIAIVKVAAALLTMTLKLFFVMESYVLIIVLLSLALLLLDGTEEEDVSFSLLYSSGRKCYYSSSSSTKVINHFPHGIVIVIFGAMFLSASSTTAISRSIPSARIHEKNMKNDKRITNSGGSSFNEKDNLDAKTWSKIIVFPTKQRMTDSPSLLLTMQKNVGDKSLLLPSIIGHLTTLASSTSRVGKLSTTTMNFTLEESCYYYHNAPSKQGLSSEEGSKITRPINAQASFDSSIRQWGENDAVPVDGRYQFWRGSARLSVGSNDQCLDPHIDARQLSGRVYEDNALLAMIGISEISKELQTTTKWGERKKHLCKFDQTERSRHNPSPASPPIWSDYRLSRDEVDNYYLLEDSDDAFLDVPLVDIIASIIRVIRRRWEVVGVRRRRRQRRRMTEKYHRKNGVEPDGIHL